MKKLMFAVVAFSVFATVAPAQDTPVVDVAVANSLFVVGKGDFLTMDGVSGSAVVNVNHWFGLVSDFGAYRVFSGTDAGLTVETYTFGPRYSFRKWGRFSPSAQVLVGRGHASTTASGFTGTTNSFAFGAGAGADVALDRGGRFALRPQVDFFGFRGNGNVTGTVRASVGLVFHIGNRNRSGS